GGPDLARRRAGTALAARYSWDASAAAHVQLYRRVVGGRDRPPEATGTGRLASAEGREQPP
nr:hypothetical protein [Micromonospora sp. DSM 115978]